MVAFRVKEEWLCRWAGGQRGSRRWGWNEETLSCRCNEG